MASIKKRGNSYTIIVSNGYSNGRKKVTESITWTPDPGMRPKEVEKALQKVSDDFEARVKGGRYLEGEKLSLNEFAVRWLTSHAEAQLKPKTVHWYRHMLDDRILPALGHLKLAQIQPSHLLKFRDALQTPGQNHSIKYRAKDPEAARAAWKASGAKVADGIQGNSLTSVLTGRNVSHTTAAKFAQLAGKKVKDLFVPLEAPRGLSANTVGHYLRVISSVMSTAVEWQLIESNPCDRVKPPRQDQKDIKHLDIDVAQELLDKASDLDNIRLKTIFILLIYTGMRREEVSGLQWTDIDLDNGVILIQRTLQQIPRQGYVISDPKTKSGHRIVEIPEDLSTQLRRYKAWQDAQRLRFGSAWQEKEHNAALEAGKPFSPVEWVITADTGYPLNPSSLYHLIKAFFRANGQPDMTVRGLRHTNASIHIANGVDIATVSKHLGHAQISTTVNIYTHALRRPARVASAKMNEVLRSQKRKASSS